MPNFNVPVVTPNPVQFQPPTDLINSYMNRRQANQEDIMNRVTGLGSTINAYHQQKIQNQLAALQAYAGVAGTSGITAANQMAPNIPGMQTTNLPQDPFSDPANTPSSVPMGGVGGGSGNAGGASSGGASSQGQPQTLGGNQQPPPQGQSPFIAASVAAGHPDYTGHMGQYQPAQLTSLAPQMAANNAQIQRASNVGGSYAADRVKKFSEANAGLAAQQTAINAPEMYQATQSNEERRFQQGKTQEADQFARTKNQEADQFARTKALEVAKGSATEADKFAEGNVKTGSGLDAFKQLEDAWNAVPDSQKGPYVGAVTKHADDLASGKFPEAVAYNKAREGLIGAIVAGIDPQGRQGPSLLEKMEKAVPTLQTSEKSRANLMTSLYKQLQSQGERNYEGHNTAAQQFGGGIPKPNFNVPTPQVPQGRITVISPTGQVGHIPQAQLKEALAEGYKQQ